jgi:2-polyprenyl-3-methyl-5-hydroxy-6-metoxy-1,4-benzoquinol methylase
MSLDTQKMPMVVELANQLIGKAPEQARTILRRLEQCPDEEARGLDDIASKITAIAGDRMASMLDDYLWLCQVMREEELYFRRHEHYRYSTFKEAFENVYSDDLYMTRYMNGLLLSQLWWSNHSEIIMFYRARYLTRLESRSRHLEIGPGHGLLLAYACDCPNIEVVVGWDISPVSLRHTEAAIKSMNIHRSPTLHLVDLFNGPAAQFESIVASEILEHTEQPRAALAAIVKNLAPSGLLFLNMPINSPAPDHLFNLPMPEDVIEFVAESGLEIIDSHLAPVTNSTIDRARRLKLTINCGIIARKVM